MAKDNVSEKQNLPKIVVILGPTAAGKTEWGIKIAKEFSAKGGPALGWDGEVVSADSRQVYKYMNIGTAKPARVESYKVHKVIKGDKKTLRQLPRDPSWKEGDDGVYVVDGIPHHLIDVVEPGESFTLADFKERAKGAIDGILKRGKLPIVVGGTGLYIQAIVENLDSPAVAPNQKLRESLEKKNPEELVHLLKQLDPAAAAKIDLNNSRRVLRALEVVIITGESFTKQQTKSAPLYDALQIGVDVARDVLYERINKRVEEQIKQGLVEETKGLAKKYDWALPSMSGIGYRQVGYYLRGEMALQGAIEVLKRDTRHYAKKQMTWFKKDKSINWIKDYKQAGKVVKKFLG